MMNSIKKGFGLAVGGLLGYATVRMVSDEILKWGAKDEALMERMKTKNPEVYENLKKHQEESESEEKEE